MSKINAQQLILFFISDCPRNFRLGLLLVISTISVSSTPVNKGSQTRTNINLPRNYCSGDVDSLGTGLVRVSVQARGKSLPHQSVKWSGWLRAGASGKYEVSLPNNGVRVFVNQQQIFARSSMSSRPIAIEIELLANRFYAISVEAPENGSSDLKLQWRRPDGRQEIIPKFYLYAPLATSLSSERV